MANKKTEKEALKFILTEQKNQTQILSDIKEKIKKSSATQIAMLALGILEIIVGLAYLGFVNLTKKEAELVKHNEISTSEKSSYHMRKSTTLLTVGSLFFLLLITSLGFNVNDYPNLKFVQYFLMGLSLLGLAAIYVGIIELFRSMKASEEFNPGVLSIIPHPRVLGYFVLVGIWLWVSYTLLPNYQDNIVPLIVGIIFAILLIVLPRSEVEKTFNK